MLALPANQRERRAAATRQLLVEEAGQLFCVKGYARTSLSEIVKNAGATKGALYHHFSDKKQLFAACYEQQAAAVAARLKTVEPSEDPWQDTLAQCRAFLGFVNMSELKAVPIQEAITVLGWQHWRAIDSRHTLAVLERSLDRLHAAGILADFDKPLLADTIFTLLASAMMTLSVAKDRVATEIELMRQLEAILGGLLDDHQRG